MRLLADKFSGSEFGSDSEDLEPGADIQALRTDLQDLIRQSLKQAEQNSPTAAARPAATNAFDASDNLAAASDTLRSASADHRTDDAGLLAAQSAEDASAASTLAKLLRSLSSGTFTGQGQQRGLHEDGSMGAADAMPHPPAAAYSPKERSNKAPASLEGNSFSSSGSPSDYLPRRPSAVLRAIRTARSSSSGGMLGSVHTTSQGEEPASRDSSFSMLADILASNTPPAAADAARGSTRAGDSQHLSDSYTGSDSLLHSRSAHHAVAASSGSLDPDGMSQPQGSPVRGPPPATASAGESGGDDGARSLPYADPTSGDSWALSPVSSEDPDLLNRIMLQLSRTLSGAQRDGGDTSDSQGADPFEQVRRPLGV